ncbi:hypothetical protein K431DRAFT_343620 [Polychaeton citri CBS 116435]|uniref:Uncharacterized protein n=1 Tax=Polychaeton citri CBS 116435 TaxID=1314669 RepID=A0A9P4UU13_9PEZI|nr:hypothetical protein K431DRAFT_343620 [Polychaeton citri CBS 116435]
MATKCNLVEDWRLQQQATRVQTKPQPRIECSRIPQSADSYGDIPTTTRRYYDASTVPAAPPPSRAQSAEYQDLPREPEIVDFSSGQPWYRRPNNVPSRKCLKSPSVYSQASARQSEVSLGILDYYMRSSIDNPDPLPPTPAVETQVIDPAIEQLDFGLTPQLELGNPYHGERRSQSGTTKLASRDTLMEPFQLSDKTYQHTARQSLSAQQPSTTSASRPKASYALFPNVEATTPSRDIVKVSQAPTVPPPAVSSPTTPVTPTHAISCREHPALPRASISESTTQPARPRNASISNSLRSRKDSFTSFHYPNKRTPLRLLSPTTTSSVPRGNKASPDSLPEEPSAGRPSSSPVPPLAYARRRDTSLPNASMPRNSDNQETSPYQTPISNKQADSSRWSDDTCPSATSTPPSQREPRTSFTSLLKKEEEYPACFFETSDDEDEATPLHQRLSWKKRRGSRKQQSGSQRHSAGTAKRNFWSKICCCCCCNEVDES